MLIVTWNFIATTNKFKKWRTLDGTGQLNISVVACQSCRKRAVIREEIRYTNNFQHAGVTRKGTASKVKK